MRRRWCWLLGLVIVGLIVLLAAPVAVNAATASTELDGLKEVLKAILAAGRDYYCSLDHTVMC